MASLWLLGITALTVAALFIWPSQTLSALPLEKAEAVSVAQAAQGRIEKTVALAGTVAYAGERYALAPQSGIAAWVTPKKEGQPIDQGEALVRLDTTAQEALLTQALEAMAQESQRQTVEAAARQALSGQPELLALLEASGALTREADALALQAQQLENAIRQGTIRAYDEGQVLKALVRQGELVQAGAPVALLASTTQQVRAQAGAQDRRLLHEGMPVRLEKGGVALGQGQIDTLEALVMDTATGLTTAQVTISLREPLALVLGDQVEVIAIAYRVEDVVTVPLAALDEEGQVWQIYEGRAWPVSGQVRAWDDESAWVEGLQEGTSVILSPPAGLKSGQRVKEAKQTP